MNTSTLNWDKPDAVTRVVADALEARSPKARYFAGTDQRMVTPVMSMLPDWVRDSLVLMVLGQNRE